MSPNENEKKHRAWLKRLLLGLAGEPNPGATPEQRMAYFLGRLTGECGMSPREHVEVMKPAFGLGGEGRDRS